MTAVLTVTCDRCGERIEADRTLLTVVSGPLLPRRETLDLCPGCADRLLSWLAGEDARQNAQEARRMAAAVEG